MTDFLSRNNFTRFLKKRLTCTIVAIFFGILISALILSLSGFNALNCFGIMIKSVFSKPKFISNVIIKSAPIILTGLSVIFAFKSGMFNIGAEGQYIAGTIASAVVGIMFNFHPFLQIPLVLLSGILAGAIMGGIVGLMKSMFGIHEVIASIMLNWIAFYTCNFVANSNKFHKPDSSGTYPINSNGFTMILNNWKNSPKGQNFLRNNKILNDIFHTDLNIGFIVAILAAILIWLFFHKTRKGYELRAIGENPDASEYAGISVTKNLILAMLISGALSGLSGALTITGISFHTLNALSSFENYGFNGLSVALIAGSSPFGCIFAGLLFSALIYSGQTLQFKIGAPSEIINIMIGIIILFVSVAGILPYWVDKIAAKNILKKEEKSDDK